MNPSREDLIRRIAEKEARLTSLERLRQEAREEIEALRDQREELAPSIAADAVDDMGSPDNILVRITAANRWSR
jgi:cell division protein FtsB